MKMRKVVSAMLVAAMATGMVVEALLTASQTRKTQKEKYTT